MPLFMDVHHLEGTVSASEVAEAHQKDVETQGKYGVNYKRYWVDENAGKIFCLVNSTTSTDAWRLVGEVPSEARCPRTGDITPPSASGD